MRIKILCLVAKVSWMLGFRRFSMKCLLKVAKIRGTQYKKSRIKKIDAQRLHVMRPRVKS